MLRMRARSDLSPAADPQHLAARRPQTLRLIGICGALKARQQQYSRRTACLGCGALRDRHRNPQRTPALLT